MLIAPGSALSLFPLRLNEFMSINNVATFAGHFNVDQCYTSNTDAALWFDFGTEDNSRGILDSMKVTAVTRADTIELGKHGRADRRHAGTDPADRHALAVRLRDQDAVQLRHVHRCLARQRDRTLDRHRYGQRLDVAARGALVHAEHALPAARGAPTDFIRRGIGEVFDKYDIETIAPGYGCILSGHKVVARHYQMLDDFLKACDKSVAVSRYVTRDEER